VLTRSRALAALAAITLAGGVFRFYNLAWGAPYYHFHIDEHFVFVGADLLRDSMQKAAESPKYFMYGPLPGYILNILRWGYETLFQPLDLTVPRDQVVYMVLGRAISAAFGTATIPLVYAIAARLAGRAAGLVAAALLASAVIHLRESHFFSVDVGMTFFTVLAWLCALRLAEHGRMRDALAAGLAFGGAILCKYSGGFVVLVIAAAYALSPRRPARGQPAAAWIRWAAAGLAPVAAGALLFLALDPMMWMHFDKFKDDLRTIVVRPLTGASRPIWTAQFADIGSPTLYWLTNILWFSLGPAFEVWSLAGIVWLASRRRRPAFIAVLFPIAYFLVAGRTIAPFIRYAVPLAPALAVAAAVLSIDLMRRSRLRRAAQVVTAIVVGSTALYAVAYMNVFRQKDTRIAAAEYLRARVPAGATVLIEPSHSTPPIGSYFTAPSFYKDHVLWRGDRRDDYFHLVGLDPYDTLYQPRPDSDKRQHIAERLAAVDWIVIDEVYVEFYEHLPEAEHRVVKQHYRDLMAGRLGFTLQRTFQVAPSIFGVDLVDDRAELTFRLFDHPRIYIFRRAAPSRQP
jgi:4-amino-4-deoxy-L-arabinose transferase-like glycosyltransferase